MNLKQKLDFQKMISIFELKIENGLVDFSTNLVRKIPTKKTIALHFHENIKEYC
jgi:hypothetical protein